MKGVVIAYAVLFSVSGPCVALANPVMDALGNVVDSLENVLGPASDPLDNAGEDPFEDGSQPEGRNPVAFPDDPLDHAGDDPFEDGSQPERQNPLHRPDDPLKHAGDDPFEDGNKPDKHNPLNHTDDPLDDLGEDPWVDDDPMTQADVFLDKMHQQYGQWSEDIAQEIQKRREEYQKQVQDERRSYAEQMRGASGPCRGIERGRIKRMFAANLERARVNYQHEVESLVLQQNMVQTQHQMTDRKSGKRPDPKQATDQAFNQGLQMCLMNERHTQDELTLAIRGYEDKKLDIEGAYQCSQMTCRGGDPDSVRACLDSARAFRQESLAFERQNFEQEKAQLDSQLQQARQDRQQLQGFRNGNPPNQLLRP